MTGTGKYKPGGRGRGEGSGVAAGGLDLQSVRACGGRRDAAHRQLDYAGWREQLVRGGAATGYVCDIGGGVLLPPLTDSRNALAYTTYDLTGLVSCARLAQPDPNGLHLDALKL